MISNYPDPQELGLEIPPQLHVDCFCNGFQHALVGGNLDRSQHFRLSFREGYRAAKLYLRELRRKRGIINFPLQGKIRMKVA